jgi:hypothetical protein
MASFDTHDLLVLDHLQRDEEVPSHLRTDYAIFSKAA